jgi:hypothetical protein
MGSGMTAAERAKRIVDDLKNRKAGLNEKVDVKIEVAERHLSAVTHKEETRHYVLLGKHIYENPANRPWIAEKLGQADISDRDREFLKKHGWAL